MVSFFKRAGAAVLTHWTAVAILLLALATVAGLANWLVPTQLVIALGQSDLDEPRIVQLLAESLVKDNSNVRLKLLRTNSASETAQALVSGQAQLAVVRSDQELVAGATSIASLRKFYPVVFTRPESRIKNLIDLRGKKIGVRSDETNNTKLAVQLLAHVGLQQGDYKFVPIARGAQASSVRLGNIDAYFGVSSDNLKTRIALNETLNQAWGSKMLVLVFEDSTVLAQRIRGVEEGKVPKGFYGGAPAKPGEDMDSIILSNRLVATEEVNQSAAVALTKALISLRDKRQADTPEVLSIQEPARNVATLPVHPGTLQLIEGQYQTWLDRYINHIFVSMAVLGTLGSILTALTSRRRRESRDQSINDVHELISLRDKISQCQDQAALQAHLIHVHKIFQDALLARAQGHISPASLALIESTVGYCQHTADGQRVLMQTNAKHQPLEQILHRRLKLSARVQPTYRR